MRAQLASLLLLASCASYPQRTEAALADFSRGHFDSAMATYGDTSVTRSPFLSGAERGMVALAAGDWAAALDGLSAAAEESRDLEERALVSVEKFGDTLASWGLNESQRPYLGEGFERVFLHCGLGLAYLGLGRIEDFGVEVRLANQLLEREEELYESQYEAGGLGHFLSALYYELTGQWDEAYIDYKRMEEKGVGLDLAGPALVRLATRLGRTDELQEWEERFGPASPPEPDSAQVVVVAGIGLGPYKIEEGMTIPTRNGAFQWSVPAYVARGQAVARLLLSTDETSQAVETAVLEDVDSVARANLGDRLGWMAAKSIGRGVLKRELTKELKKEHGTVGLIVGDIFTFVTERADLRAWQTLPGSWQACRAFLPPGTHTLVLDAVGGETRELGRFELEPGETMFVFARTLGPRLWAHPIGGRLIEPAEFTLTPSLSLEEGP